MGPDLRYSSKKLNISFSYYDIPDLTDQELTTIYYELSGERTAVSAQLSLYKNLENRSEREEVSFLKGVQKKKIVDGFYKEIKYELERRFIVVHNLNESTFEKLRSQFYTSSMENSKFLPKFLSLLEETYGESTIANLKHQAVMEVQNAN